MNLMKPTAETKRPCAQIEDDECTRNQDEQRLVPLPLGTLTFVEGILLCRELRGDPCYAAERCPPAISSQIKTKSYLIYLSRHYILLCFDNANLDHIVVAQMECTNSVQPLNRGMMIDTDEGNAL